MKRLIPLVVLTASLPTAAQTAGNDGSLSYSYTFPLPPARGRHQPSLALAYSSGQGTTAYGAGWVISASYVEASTRATPKTDGTIRTRYLLVNGGSRQLLVPVAVGSPSYRVDVARD